MPQNLQLARKPEWEHSLFRSCGRPKLRPAPTHQRGYFCTKEAEQERETIVVPKQREFATLSKCTRQSVDCSQINFPQKGTLAMRIELCTRVPLRIRRRDVCPAAANLHPPPPYEYVGRGEETLWHFWRPADGVRRYRRGEMQERCPKRRRPPVLTRGHERREAQSVAI